MPRRLLPIAVITALVAAAVGAAAPAQASSWNAEVNVRISADHHVHVATALPAGVVHFHVRGGKEETFQLARAKNGATAEQLVADDALLNKKEDASGIVRDFDAIGGAVSGSDLWLRLAPGTYFAFNPGDEKAKASDVVTVTVTGDEQQGALPKAAATIRAVHEMDWGRTSHLPSSGELGFVNTSTEYHFIVLQQLKPGTTIKQVLQAIKKNDRSRLLSASISTGVLSPGQQQLSGYRLPKGLYALACFWPDEHGVPHALMGMLKLVHVG